jgi:hypothetical protein
MILLLEFGAIPTVWYILFYYFMYITSSTRGLYPFKSVADHDIDTSIYSNIIKSQNVRLIDCCLTIVSNISIILFWGLWSQNYFAIKLIGFEYVVLQQATNKTTN